MITQEQFNSLFPRVPVLRRRAYLTHLNAACAEFRITSRRRAAAFLAQLAHESAGLVTWEENLNYSAKRLIEVFPHYFRNTTEALPYHRQPQKLANFVYANRMGNGAPASGDGYRFRGRCPIQATGRDMYAWLAGVLDLPLVEQPDLLLKPEHGFRAAAAIFAREKNLLHVADRLNGRGDEADLQQFDKISRKINGGTHGRLDRRNHYVTWLRLLTDRQFNPATAALPAHAFGFAPAAQDDAQPASTPADAPQGACAPGNGIPVESPVDEPTLAAALDELPVSTETAAKAAGLVKTRLALRLARPLVWLWAALEAGNVFAWLGVAIAAACAGYYGYVYRAHLRRALIWIIRKLKGSN